jgi:hypothetical protein
VIVAVDETDIATDIKNLEEGKAEGGLIDVSGVVGYAEGKAAAPRGGKPRGVVVVLDSCRELVRTSDFKDIGESKEVRAWSARKAKARSIAGEAPGVLVGNSASRGTPFYVFYSTSRKQVATEVSEGRNSPFTGAFVKHVSEAGLPLTKLVTAVAADVRASTGDQQEPWGEGAPELYDLALVPAPKVSAESKGGSRIQPPVRPVQQLRPAPSRMPPGETSFGVN